MTNYVRRFTGTSIGLVLLATAGGGRAQNATGPSQASSAPAASAPDSSGSRSGSYYHFMLARRYQELAGIYNRSDYVERAIAEYKKAMEDDPNSLFLRANLAELYARVGRVGDAVKEAEAILKVNPDQVDAHRLLATIYLHNLGENQTEITGKDSLRRAIGEYEALIRLNPSEVESLVTLGRLYKLNNQDDKAEETFKKALNVDPGSKGAVNYLAQLYLDQGANDQTIELLKKIPEEDSS
jgi:tetratricopeptide (TPR) repeat protein